MDEKQKVKHHPSDFEYVNGMSRKAWPVLVWTIGLSAFIYWFSWSRYRELSNWEATGGRIRMTSIEKLCYELGGITVFPALTAIVATIIFVAGIREYRRRRRLLE